MNWKRIALGVLLVVVLVGALTAAGILLYRAGYTRGAAEALAEEGMPRFELRGDTHFRGPSSMMPLYGIRTISPLGLFGFGLPLLALGLLLLLSIAAGALIGSLISKFRSASPED